MTSNIGGELRSDGLGFSPAGRTGETESALRQAFSPEFLGRLDRIVCFDPLGVSAMDAIAKKYLGEIEKRLENMGVQLQLPDELAHSLGKRCGQKEGARHLRRLVQDEVEGPLAVLLLKSSKKPSKIRASYKEGALQFHG